MGLSKNQPLSAHQWIGITPRFLFSRRSVCLAWPGPLPLPRWPALVPPPVCACGARAGSVPALPGPSGTLSRKLDVTLPYSLATISKLVIDDLAQARSASAAAEEASEDFTTAS